MAKSSRWIFLRSELLEYGNELLTTGDSTEELLKELDGLEDLLLHLGQACKSVVEESLESAKKALISNKLLRHAEEDVRITVASCISEIVRIIAPDEPYEEDQMKDYFQLANAAFQKLPSMAGRAYSKAVSILQTISYCQICVMMLDFELHDMVHEMFNLFLNGIQSTHPQAVFSSMEHIMILIIQNNEDSDEFSIELAKILLATLKKGNQVISLSFKFSIDISISHSLFPSLFQNVSPLAFQLAKNVFENCANDLKDYLPEAVRCMGADVKEYDVVVVSSFRDAMQKEMDAEETRTDASLENNLIDNLKNDENVNENYGTVLHSCDQTNQQESVSLDAKQTGLAASSHGEVDLSRDGGLSKLVECSNLDILKIDPNVNENCCMVSHFGDRINSQESILDRIHFTPGPDVDCSEANSPSKDDVTKFPAENSNTNDVGGINVVQEECKSNDVPLLSKRIRKPHSIIKPEEGYDPLWVWSQCVSIECSHSRKSTKPKTPHLPSSHVVESKKEKLDQIPGKDLLAGDGILENPVKKKRSSTRVVLRKGLDKSLLGNRIDGIHKSLEKGQGSPNKVERVEKRQCKSNPSEDISGDILIKTLVSRSRNISSKGITDSVEVSSQQCQSEVILPKQENQSKKRRRSLAKKAPRDTSEEEASKVNPAGKCVGEDLVGHKIKVWWPVDRTYYEGKVTSFNSLNMKHQVDYDDGDIETLNLAHQCWEMIDDNLSSHEQNMVPSSTVRSRDPGLSSSSSSRKKLKGLWKQILG